MKANDCNSLLPITLELEEPELNKFAAQAKEIGIVYHCDSVIGFGIKPNAGFRLYVRVYLMEEDFIKKIKNMPYGIIYKAYFVFLLFLIHLIHKAFYFSDVFCELLCFADFFCAAALSERNIFNGMNPTRISGQNYYSVRQINRF